MTQPITLYALSTCAHCRKVGELLTELVGSDEFKHVYVDRLSGDERNTIMRELRSWNPQMSFPTTIIGKTVITGDKEETIRKALKD